MIEAKFKIIKCIIIFCQLCTATVCIDLLSPCIADAFQLVQLSKYNLQSSLCSEVTPTNQPGGTSTGTTTSHHDISSHHSEIKKSRLSDDVFVLKQSYEAYCNGLPQALDLLKVLMAESKEFTDFINVRYFIISIFSYHFVDNSK